MKEESKPEYWLEKRKWTNFLKAIPANKPMGFVCDDANMLMRIRVTASILSNSPSYDRRFAVTVNYQTRVVTITATEKTK